MSVYKPAKSPYWWYDFQHQGRRFYGSTGATSRKKALDVERLKREAAGRGERNRPELRTLDEAAAEWWVYKGKDKASAKDIAARIRMCRKLIGPQTLVTEITTATVAEAITKRRAIMVRGKTPPSNATINRDIVSTLRPILKRAARLAPGVIFPAIDWAELWLDEPEPTPKRFSSEELTGLNEALPAYYHEFARFKAKYGPRLAGMFFHPNDVDLEAGTVLLRKGKNGKDHIVPLTKADRPWIAGLVAQAREAGLDTIWCRRLKNGKLKPLTYRSALRAFMVGMTDSGLRETKGARGAHALRHHSAMNLLGATGNIRSAQKVLGHVSLQSTQVYAHAMVDDARDALEAVESRNSPEPAKSSRRKSSKKQAVA